MCTTFYGERHFESCCALVQKFVMLSKGMLPGFEIPVVTLLNSIDCDLVDVIAFKFG